MSQPALNIEPTLTSGEYVEYVLEQHLRGADVTAEMKWRYVDIVTTTPVLQSKEDQVTARALFRLGLRYARSLLLAVQAVFEAGGGLGSDRMRLVVALANDDKVTNGLPRKNCEAVKRIGTAFRAQLHM